MAYDLVAHGKKISSADTTRDLTPHELLDATRGVMEHVGDNHPDQTGRGDWNVWHKLFVIVLPTAMALAGWAAINSASSNS